MRSSLNRQAQPKLQRYALYLLFNGVYRWRGFFRCPERYGHLFEYLSSLLLWLPSSLHLISAQKQYNLSRCKALECGSWFQRLPAHDRYGHSQNTHFLTIDRFSDIHYYRHPALHGSGDDVGQRLLVFSWYLVFRNSAVRNGMRYPSFWKQFGWSCCHIPINSEERD